jgi:hypothetical protein
VFTLTIDGIDDILENEINEKAEIFGLSRTETVKKILTDALLPNKIEERRKMFAPFCGIWTDSDTAEFNEAIKDLETANPEDWE